jgi:branched-chain amino acid transport system ATP-binding protein
VQASRIISQEHGNLWRIATTLEQVADELAAGQAVEPAFFASVFDYLEHFVDRNHHRKEDEHLFARLALRDADAQALIDRLQGEHREGSGALTALRQQLGESTGQSAAFADTLRRYADDLKAHVRLEERELLPRARLALLDEDWAAIDAAFLDHTDPVFGAEAQGHWRELFHRVASLAPVSVGLGAHSGGQLTATPAPAMLQVEQLQSHYGRIQALKGVSLEVRRGELVALVGANGAGKTTLLRTLSGVQPASGGRIAFDGDDITGWRPERRMKRGICQSPEGRQVFGPLSIEDNLRLGAYTRPTADAEGDLERIYTMFPVLKEKRRLAAGNLSGGQQQMLAIGRALMGRPQLLLLDEPSMGLAPLLVQEVFNVVTTLREQGMTILLVEQNASAALAIADRGYVLETGQVILQGSGQQLLDDPEVRKAYLGM